MFQYFCRMGYKNILYKMLSMLCDHKCNWKCCISIINIKISRIMIYSTLRLKVSSSHKVNIIFLLFLGHNLGIYLHVHWSLFKTLSLHNVFLVLTLHLLLHPLLHRLLAIDSGNKVMVERQWEKSGIRIVVVEVLLHQQLGTALVVVAAAVARLLLL